MSIKRCICPISYSISELDGKLGLMLEQGGAISGLECQVPYILGPNTRVIIDFRYVEADLVILEDVKGIDKRTGQPVSLTATVRAKYAWLADKYGLTVRIV